MSQISGKIDKDFCLDALKNADNERGKPTDRERNRLLVCQQLDNDVS